MICVLVYTYLSVTKKVKKRTHKPFLIIILFAIHILFLLAVVFLSLYFLTPKPTATMIAPSSITPAPVQMSKIEIVFDRPVQRKKLVRSIEPHTPGVWVFEDPLYTKHLFRKLVFYPYFPLKIAMNYTVKLSDVTNFLQIAPPETVRFTFHTVRTPWVPPILGIQSDTITNERVQVAGSFPSDGWNGVTADTTIRIRFNRQVNVLDAQSRFSLFPVVSGTFSWDGDTMVFTPSLPLDFNTRYTFFIASGIKSSSGEMESTDGFAASFTTQEEETKLHVPAFLQKYALSCEVATLRMVLAYRGITVTEDQLLDTVGVDPTQHTGSLWGNPYVGFVGSVRGKQFLNGYGVYWEPIARAANSYRYSIPFENWTLTKLTGSIQRSNPVIVWISIRGKEPTVWKTPAGDTIRAVPDEHTVVVIGFVGTADNPTHFIVNDPLTGEVYWTKESFEKKWKSFGNSGVVVF